MKRTPESEADNEFLRNILQAIKDHEAGKSRPWNPEKYLPKKR
jgi:hypothetical protein